MARTRLDRQHYSRDGHPKAAYRTWEGARAHARRIGAEAYLCRGCGRFHVGNRRRPEWNWRVEDEVELGRRAYAWLRAENQGSGRRRRAAVARVLHSMLDVRARRG